MAEPALITTPTKPFGWALNDLTLYGGQPLPGMAIGAAPDAGAPLVTAAPAFVPTQTPEGDVAAGETTALLNDAANQPDFPHEAGSGLAPVAPSTPAPIAAPMPAPAPVGAGSIVTTAPVATPLHAVEAAHAVDPQAETTTASAPAIDTLAGVTDTPVLHDVIAPLAGTLDALPIAPVVDGLTSTVAGTVDGLAGTVTTIVDQVPGLPDTVTTALGEVTGVAHSALDAIGLDSFGGTDPAAGLTTLIGMVESADMFDLGHAVTPGAADQAPSSILDTLTADELVSPLLGGDEHHGGDHLIDGHGIHVDL